MTPTNIRILCVSISLLAGASCTGATSGDMDGDGSGDGDGGGSGSEVVCESSALAPDCTPDWYGDLECDPSNNLAACEWDGGDCCAATCTEAGCGAYGFECRDPGAGGTGMPEPETIGDACAEVADPFAPAQLQTEATLLSNDALAGRVPGSSGDLTTRAYVEERFRCLGLAPGAGGCFQQAFHNDDGDPTANVIALVEGSDPALADEVIVVGAHHDHLGIIEGETYNGANDNVSGLVALMAIADQLARSDAPRRTIALIAFGSEESGLEGARHFAVNPPPNLPMENVVYMVNLDMLGVYDVAAGVDAYGTFPGTPGRAVTEDVLASHPELDVTLGVVAPDDGSDQDPFCESGIPYVYFETWDEPCWHEPCDDPERMDYVHMSEIVEVLHGVVVGLANSDTDLSDARDELGCSTGSGVAPRRPPHRNCRGSLDLSPSQTGAAMPPIKRRARHRH